MSLGQPKIPTPREAEGHPPPLTLFTGTKAQFIKLVPVAIEFERRGWPYRIIDTGQHAQLVQHIIHQFHLREPDSKLALGEAGVSTLGEGFRWILRIMRLLARHPTRIREDLFSGQRGLSFVLAGSKWARSTKPIFSRF